MMGDAARPSHGAARTLAPRGTRSAYDTRTALPTVSRASSAACAAAASASDLFARGLSASAAIGPRSLIRRGGMRDLEERALTELADGRLVPLVQRFALAEAAAAHAALEARETVGKAVLVS
jgi:NADPH:quinone reductase-like Zn-dependent oxidoreductase